MQPSRGLSPSALEAIAALERRVVAADGGRLKLEWGALRNRSGRSVEDLLWWDQDLLAGFLGIYSHGAPVLELAGMVDPAARRRGIGAALLDAALALCGERTGVTTLLVVPRASAAGRELARSRGGTLDHSEHALELLTRPDDVPADPRLTLRPERPADRTAVRELLRAAFDWEPPAPEAAEAAREPVDPDAFVVERDGAVLGTVRLNLHRERGEAGIYGFVVHPDHRGRGIGRDVLHRLCRGALTDGARRVHLEVATDNDRALGLYTSLGFTPVTTEDYWALPRP